MRLIDPDGGIVGRTAKEVLRCPIPLSVLGKSRDAAGNPRLDAGRVAARSQRRR